MAATSVKVFIYDISKGLARSMSMAFLGKQLDGIWHTAVVAYGQEIFYGGDGINSCTPGGTILGQPDQIFDMGSTEIPYEVFMDYMNDIATSSFRPECYHLFNKNCNNFTAEVANFLTGQHIPSHITSLPADVLDTPFGAMIKPFVDSMSVSPSGGHAMFPDSVSQQPHHQTSTDKTTQKTENRITQPSNSTNTKQESNDLEPWVYDGLEIKEINGLHTQLKSDLSTTGQQMLADVGEYLTDSHCNWSLGRPHIDTLLSLLISPALSSSQQLQVLKLWQRLVVKDDVVHLLGQDTDHKLMKFFNNYSSYTIAQQTELTKMVCNCCKSKKGRTFLTNTSSWPIENENTSNCRIVSQLCTYCLMSEDKHLRETGAALGYNLTIYQIDEDTAVELSSAMLQSLTNENNEQTAFHMISSLKHLIDSNSQVLDLCKVIGINCDELRLLSARVKTLCENLQIILTT